MVAREEDVGHGVAAEGGRTRVGGRVEGVAGERFGGEGFGVDRARHESHRRIDEREGRDLAAGEHEIAEGDLLGAVEVDEALVDALVVAADDDQPVERGEALRVALAERGAGGGGHDDRAAFVGGRGVEDRVEHACEGLDAQHHAGAPAEGAVIGPFSVAERVEEMVEFDAHEPAFLGAAEDREPDRGSEELREERDDVDV